jgi:hypothetical protein
MTDAVPALLPLALLEAVQNIDTPPDDGLGALEAELAAKRLGLSPTVAAQIARYRELANSGGDVATEEVVAVFRLVGRRPDAALVYADAGRRAGRYTARRQGRVARALLAIVPARVRRLLGLRAAAGLARHWLRADLRAVEGLARCEMEHSLAIQARDDGVGCQFYTNAFAELLRLVASFEGPLLHEGCLAHGDRTCRWRAMPAGGYE